MRGIALAVALVAFAVPVGDIHLWFIRRSVADPVERGNGIRHQFLNLRVAFALLAELIAGTALINTAIYAANADATGQVAVMVVGATGAWWVARTAPASGGAGRRS